MSEDLTIIKCNHIKIEYDTNMLVIAHLKDKILISAIGINKNEAAQLIDTLSKFIEQ